VGARRAAKRTGPSGSLAARKGRGGPISTAAPQKGRHRKKKHVSGSGQAGPQQSAPRKKGGKRQEAKMTHGKALKLQYKTEGASGSVVSGGGKSKFAQKQSTDLKFRIREGDIRRLMQQRNVSRKEAEKILRNEEFLRQKEREKSSFGRY